MNILAYKKKKASSRSFSFMAIIAFSLISCQFQFSTHNPVTGRNEVSFVSENEEIEVGEELFESMIQEAGGRYDADPALSAYVNSVGQKLAKVSDRPNLPYEFVIVNDDTLNAWALPGGKIAINKGLLLILDNEAELASILGHEITHAAARHSAERWERSTIKPGIDLLQTMFNPAHALIVATEYPGEVVESKYSRDAENEADRYGLEYMARAGYDISAAKTVHEKLLKASAREGNQKTIADTLLSSHPDDADRICNLDELSQYYPAEGILGAATYKEKTASLHKHG